MILKKNSMLKVSKLALPDPQVVVETGEHYQVYDCNVEMHEDLTNTSQSVDIIYPLWAWIWC